MSENAILIAETRDRVGKGTSRALRRAGRTPAVIYGDKKDPISISVESKDVVKHLNTGGFLATVYTVEVDGKKHNVLPRDIQLDPAKDTPVHIDFLRVSDKSLIAIMLPVNFINEDDCVGLTRGGILNVVRHEIEMNVPAGNIPDGIDVDLANADIGDSIHISEITLPENCVPTITDRDFTVVTIAAPIAEEVEEEAETDVEVIGEKAAEGNAAEEETE